MRKIAFFDVDGTLTSEIDGNIPESTVSAIRRARENGNLMFINTGRCFQNLEPRFREIGFDGYICGCGTNIFCQGKEILHVAQTHEITMQLLKKARETNIDIIFESRKETAFDMTRPLNNPECIKLYEEFVQRGYDMPENLEHPNFYCDKFVIWYQEPAQLEAFRSISDRYFECIDRGGLFREFVPLGYSKAASGMSSNTAVSIRIPPTRSATAATTFPCFNLFRTALPWETLRPTHCLNRCPM